MSRTNPWEQRVDNPLLFADHSRMLYGDAKKPVGAVTEGLEAL